MKVTGTIVKLDRMNNSVNGSPVWRITLDGGEVLRTESDSSISYGLGNPEFRDVPVTFELTKSGRVFNAKVAE